MTPRIFVGTMYMREGDFPLCLDRIQRQEGVTVSHVIISGMPEKEAHNALWANWRLAQKDHDLFVKVDADTVLASRATLAEIYALFKADPRVTGMQAPLHDHMTDGLINGLNCFSTRVVFNDTRDELYCDRHVDTNHDVVLRQADLPSNLAPAGFHCHSANPRQAFHYGVHRALKGQKETISRVRKAWLDQGGDQVRMYALIGAMMAPRFAVNRRFNYGDPEFNQAFDEAKAQYDALAAQVVR